jgi:hypothetical protein
MHGLCEDVSHPWKLRSWPNRLVITIISIIFTTSDLLLIFLFIIDQHVPFDLNEVDCQKASMMGECDSCEYISLTPERLPTVTYIGQTGVLSSSSSFIIIHTHTTTPAHTVLPPRVISSVVTADELPYWWEAKLNRQIILNVNRNEGQPDASLMRAAPVSLLRWRVFCCSCEVFICCAIYSTFTSVLSL